MENEIPQMTPEQIAAMQAQQPQGEVQPEQTATPEPESNPEDEVATAKDMLGINSQNETIQAMQSRISQMEQKEVSEAMAKKYPDVPIDLVEKEIAKLEAINPEFGVSMRNTEDGREMAYKAAIASISPKEKPDNLTDGEGSGETMESLEEAVSSGKASEFQLGDFILGQN